MARLKTSFGRTKCHCCSYVRTMFEPKIRSQVGHL
jgi:hypothetical protein